MTESGRVRAEGTAALRRLLIANRGEIALRIGRSAAEAGIAAIAVHPDDDSESGHVRAADEALKLPGHGARAYLDIDAVIAAAERSAADAVHPGYGFLSENADFARRVEETGRRFIGPAPETLEKLGDKHSARALAVEMGVPVLPGSDGPVDLDGARAFLADLPHGAAMMIKAVAGGGGRGMRRVADPAELDEAWERCRSEAEAAFGSGALYVERFMPGARHVEVQIIGDGTGACLHLGERDCTLQRRNQKVVEIAPSPWLSPGDRERLTAHAVRMAEALNYRSLGTWEFLVAPGADGQTEIAFLEVNPRIQVEHTVTEEVYDLDLVALQLQIAQGARLTDLGLDATTPRGHSVQMRVNLERMDSSANAVPTGGVLSRYEPPTGPGVRVDGFASTGYRTSGAYDSLLAKVIVHARGTDFGAALRKADRALGDFRIEGVETNLPWLRALLARREVGAGEISTGFIADHAAELAETAPSFAPAEAAEAAAAPAQAEVTLPPGTEAVRAPMQATVVSLAVAEGDEVRAGQQVAVLEAMKMEHVIEAPQAGLVHTVLAAPGETLMDGAPILAFEPGEVAGTAAQQAAEFDPGLIRPDLREVIDRRAFGLDENRPKAVEKRHGRGHRTARENLASVCDPGSFVEFGEFTLAAQSARRTQEDLIENTTGDGILTGLGRVNGAEFDDKRARCAFAVGDYMVLAGTQGQRHHKKLDRIFHTAADWNIPLVLFAEGGGGRPGDTDRATYAGVSNPSFSRFAELSGKVPLVGVVSGRCFAGNAALLGCCDVIIADESSNIGMAGPAMIEGGGLGVYPPEAIGPIDEQCANGVVDIRVKDEEEACEVAKKYLSYFQGPVADWTAPDPRKARHVVPENRLRVYEMRDAIEAIADVDSVLELRREWGDGMVTALIRIGGKPFGVMGNNPKHLGGAIDADASDKASRFMQLCDAFDIPLISLCDSPGFMVGPEAEKTALVRHVSRMYVTARSVTVPIFAVVTRKCYGLGAMAMIGGGSRDNFFTISWPTGEFGPMGLEGAVRLGFRKELEAEKDPAAKQALYDKLLAQYYEQGKALNVAATQEIDAVIDPAETRDWLLAGLDSAQLRAPLSGRKRPFVDAW